jgi:hypothetical protein
MSIKNTIRDLVGDAKIDRALDTLLDWVNQNESDISNSVILLKGRFSTLERNNGIGILENSEYNREHARITQSILMMLDDIKEGESPTPQPISISKPPLQFVPPVINTKILFLASNPFDTGKLQLDKEFVEVYKGLQSNRVFELQSEWAVTPTIIQTTILKHKPSILHFSGHGMGDGIKKGRAIGRVEANKPVTGLILQDAMGKMKVIETQFITNLFEILFKYNIKINAVILNACYSKNQAETIKNYVNYVVGMSDAIGDDSAIVFAREFYSVLAIENNVEMAFDLAKNAIGLEGLDDDDLPVLYKKD